jgi:hypothetical protein
MDYDEKLFHLLPTPLRIKITTDHFSVGSGIG